MKNNNLTQLQKEFYQTKKERIILNQHIKTRLKEMKEENSLKKLMSVDILQFLISTPAYNYKMSVVPQGKGLYNVRVVETQKGTGRIRNDGQIFDYFSHSMSMNKAKDILLIFLNDWDK